MNRLSTVILFFWTACVNILGQAVLLPVSQKALYDTCSVHHIDFRNYPQTLQDMPIGVFDSGTGGFTVLEKILSQDRFNNQTGEEMPDGIPDFIHEDFEYLADQANMPYGRYDAEGKSDYLRELAVKDALFLLSNHYWKDAQEIAPTGKKRPVKIIVIACNTATAYGLEHIQNLLNESGCGVKVIGVVNAGAASTLASLKDKKETSIGVLATPGTISSNVYERTLRAMAPADMQLEIVNQPGYGFAEAVDEEKAFVNHSLEDFSEDYRGPVFGNGDNDINAHLLSAYGFDLDNGAAFIEYNAHGEAVKIQLNTADNYARYNLLGLFEQARKQGIRHPISRIILGCTHYPFTLETLKKHLDELKHYKDADGNYPYASLIADDCEFIDPAVNTAYECYKTLVADNNLRNDTVTGILEPYISVASSWLPADCLDNDGNLTYAFKYGREVGKEDLTTVCVPFSEKNVSSENLTRIARLLPLCSRKICTFLHSNTSFSQ
ncbi:MAG: aspartate/glutamate racemase family protein [Prevotella sp.]|nr:aspartate/glutamate racemase family protein [Prevotella sp.]